MTNDTRANGTTGCRPGTAAFSRESAEYLCATVLRPGNCCPARFRAHFLMLLDGRFATRPVDFPDAEADVRYVVAVAKNSVLQRNAEAAWTKRAPRALGPQHTAQAYAQTRYAAAHLEPSAARPDQGRSRPPRRP